MNAENIKRRIRKLLHLAADARGNAAQARAAAALAKRLMRANGWTMDDLRDGALPTDASERIVIACKNGEDQRFMAATKIVMTRFKTITTRSRKSAVSLNVIIDLYGAKAELQPAVNLWHSLNCTLAKYWREQEEAQAVGKFVQSRLSRIFSSASVSTPPDPDEPSWLKGVVDGFWCSEHQDVKWKDTVEAKEIKQLAKPWKPKRRRLPKKNPMALAVIPKPREIVDVRPVKMTLSQLASKDHSDSVQALKAFLQKASPENEPDTEPYEVHRLDDYSYRSGWRLGHGLYQRLKEQ